MELVQGSEVMLRRESDTRGLFSSAETSDHDCDMGASCEDVCDVVCLCHTAPCTLYPEAHMPTPDTLMCNSCGKNRVVMTQYSEGYGTEEECVLSDPQGESDADADIEDTDCRLQEPGSLQRISSRRRKRPRLARQDTTESEDDGGGRSHRSHRWNLRPSPQRAHSRTIPEVEESISQVRPLVICRPSQEVQISSLHRPLVARRLPSLLPSSVPIALVLLLSLPLSLSLLLLLLSFLGPRADT